VLILTTRIRVAALTPRKSRRASRVPAQRLTALLERPRGVSLRLATAEIVRLLRAYLTCAPEPA
jgi:hypothetical protein